MNLDQFVTESLLQIINGVNAAKEKAPKSLINPAPRGDTSLDNLHQQGYTPSEDGKLIQQVEFDVAVTAVVGTETKGGIGIMVAGIGLGTRGQTDKSNTSISRLKFKVPIALP